jgi:hypothetical protein
MYSAFLISVVECLPYENATLLLNGLYYLTADLNISLQTRKNSLFLFLYRRIVLKLFEERTGC